MNEPATTPRCRFAPSPTGYLHVGSAQSALFNWMFARGSGGTMLLRIEDTDIDRNQPELEANIVETLGWLGIDWDEPLVRQSQRRGEHLSAADRLHAGEHAYWCDCTAVDRERSDDDGASQSGCVGGCRTRELEPGPGRALRFAVPSGSTSWDDLIRGPITIDNADIEDFVIVRSSGQPVFVLANAVDDHHMAVSHVIRGEDHISNTAKYILVWQALDFGPLPRFAHLPLLVDADRKKLSKRHGSVAVEDFRRRGVLPAALRNHLALLGWSPREGEEIQPIDDMAAGFRIEDVNASPSFFDEQKLEHINGEYLRAMPDDEFAELAEGFVDDDERVRALVRALAGSIKQRVGFLDQVPATIEFAVRDDIETDADSWRKAMSDQRATVMLDTVRRDLGALAEWRADEIETVVKEAGLAAGYVKDDGTVQLAKAQAPVRVAATGTRVGLPLWESLALLGRERTLERIDAALDRLRSDGGG